MQLANCLLILNEYGSCVPKANVTPAEVQFLIWSHQENARKLPINDLQILDLFKIDEERVASLEESIDVTDAEAVARRTSLRRQLAQNDLLKEVDGRTSAAEKMRLRGIYKSHSNDPKALTIETLWPGANSVLPKNFSDVVDAEGRPVFDKDGSILSAAKNTKSIEVDGETFTADEIREMRRLKAA